MNEPFQLSRQNVVRNILALFSGSAFAQGLTAITFILMARQLGSEVYGTFTSSLALTSITALLFNLGLDMWLLQAAGRTPGDANKLFGSTVSIKLAFSGFWILLLLIFRPFLNTTTFPQAIYWWTALVVWLDSLFLSSLNIFKATLQNKYTLILEPVSDFAWLLSTLFLIFANTKEVLPFLQWRAVVLFCSLAIALWLIWRRYRIGFDKKIAEAALRDSPPYAVSAILGTTAQRMDLLIIALFLGNAAAGLYSPALSLVNTLFFIPAAVANVMIPVLSRLYHVYPAQARKTGMRQYFLQLVIGIGLFLIVLIGAPWLVKFLGDTFTNSLELIYILSFILLIRPLSIASASILVASGNQKKRVLVQLIVAVLTIILDVIAVLYFDLVAVAYVYIVVEFVHFLGNTWLVVWLKPGQISLKSSNEPSG